MTTFDPNNDIDGKVYDLTQDNFNRLLEDWRGLRTFFANEIDEIKTNLYNDILFIVCKHMNWSQDKGKLWMDTENPMLGGSSPATLILRGRGHKVKLFVHHAIEENSPE